MDEGSQGSQRPSPNLSNALKKLEREIVKHNFKELIRGVQFQIHFTDEVSSTMP